MPTNYHIHTLYLPHSVENLVSDLINPVAIPVNVKYALQMP